MNKRRKPFVIGLSAIIVAVVGIAVLLGRRSERSAAREATRQPAPVAVATIEHGPLTLQRTFTGTLEAYSSFVVAPKVGGRIEALFVDISDEVQRGQVVAQLDDAEFEQTVAQAKADLAVAEANLAQARSQADIAKREIDRISGLTESGFTSTSQMETAEAQRLAREAQLRVAQAQITRAEAALASSRIRLGYCRVVANWDEAGDTRIVAERFVEEGDTVSANSPLTRIVEIDRMIAVIFVTEKEYGRLQPGQQATFVTDAFPGEIFSGAIVRIAPVFREATRQARVELLVANPGRRLKPGMFARATLVLDRVEDTTFVPESALSRRNEIDGLFVVDAAGETVRWVPVRTGIRDGGRVEVFGEGLEGRVVVLGQQLINDGSAITIP